MNPKTVHRYPFLRILIPLIAGIACSDGLFYTLHGRWPEWFPLLGAGWLLLLWVLHATGRKSDHMPRWLFGAALAAGLFLTGMHTTCQSLRQAWRNDDTTRQTYVARIGQPPSEKPKTVGFQATLTGPAPESTPFEAMLYVAKDSNSLQLKRGDCLLVHTRITRPRRYGTPDEFDYPRFLLRKGIAGSGYVATDAWQPIAHPPAGHSLAEQALQGRDRVLAFYEKAGLTGDRLAVLAALTTGYKAKLTDELRQTYSDSGASHLLAVSGLHAGFIYTLIISILGFTGRVGRHPVIRTVIVLAVLWSFALFTGLSASVVRAVIMASLFTLSQGLARGQRPGNSLLMAAFLMLVFRPLWLFDVGFQLSFCAVAGILLLYPRLEPLVRPTTAPLRYLWRLSCVSIAAQAGTVPLVCYYFGQFPTHFLLTNLVAVPLASLIVYAAVAMLVSLPLPALSALCATAAGHLTEALNSYLRWIETLPGAVLRSVSLYTTDVAACFVLAVALLMFLHQKTFRNYLVLASLAILFSGLRTIRQFSDRPDRSILFYNLPGTQAIQCIEPSGDSWMLYPSGQNDSVRTTRQLERFWNRSGLRPIRHTAQPLSLPQIRFQHNWLQFHNTAVLVLNRHTGSHSPSPRLSVDYLYLSKDFRGDIARLRRSFDFGHVVTDGSMPAPTVQRLKKECQSAQIPFTALSEKGYLQVKL